VQDEKEDKAEGYFCGISGGGLWVRLARHFLMSNFTGFPLSRKW